MSPGSIRPRARTRTLSAAEALLWDHLRSLRLEGWRFLRRSSTSTSTCASTSASTRAPASNRPTTTFVCPDAGVTVQVASTDAADSHSEGGPLTFTSFEVLAATEAVLQTILVALRTALTHRRSN